MTPQNIIKANLCGAGAPRPGFCFPGERLNDFVLCWLPPTPGFDQRRRVEGEVEYYYDEWGNEWHRLVGGCVKGEISKPFLSDWKKLSDLTLPNNYGAETVDALRQSFAAAPEKYHVASLGGWIFDSARYLRQLDRYLMDMIEHPDELRELHRQVASVYRGRLLAAAAAGAAGVLIAEDMGTQTGLLFSPQMWHDYFGELYTELFALAHENNLKVFMHSCGQNSQIIEPLLKAGVDVLQFDQPEVYDLRWLAGMLEKYEAALFSPLDIQKILPTGDRELIEAGVERMHKIFAGRLIYKQYPDLPGIGVKEEWNTWAYERMAALSGVG